MKLVLTRGLPGSGKSTWARAWVAEDPGKRTRINRDDLRSMLFGGWTGLPDHEAAVTCVQRAAILHLVTIGWSVVVDDTNLNPDHLAALVAVGEAAGAEVEVHDMTDVPVKVCVERDAARLARGERGVGEAVIRRMYERWLSNGQA